MTNISSDKICLICKRPASEMHHLKHRATGGTDDDFNVIPICRYDHVRIHAIGLKAVASKCKDLTDWLLNNGWTLDGDGRKWRRYEPEENT